MVDNIGLCCIYSQHTARRRSAEWRASEAPHFPVICHRLESVAAASQALWRVWGAGWLVPGCLTGESEERETWTAESLRAASPNEDLCLRGERPDETSAVDVSGQHPVASGRRRVRCKSRALVRPPRREWDLVKRCDQPGKVLIQLESLILAQSERWRQA